MCQEEEFSSSVLQRQRLGMISWGGVTGRHLNEEVGYTWSSTKAL